MLQVIELGSEEGCPEERPSDLDEIMSRPITASPITKPMISIFLYSITVVIDCLIEIIIKSNLK